MGSVIINDKYRVDVESNCLTIRKFAGISDDKRKGKIEVWTYDGFFSNWNAIFDALVKRFVAEKIDKKGRVDLIELKKIFVETRNELRRMIKPLLDTNKL